MLRFKIYDCPDKSHRTVKDWANCPLAHKHEPNCRYVYVIFWLPCHEKGLLNSSWFSKSEQFCRRHPAYGYSPVLCQNRSNCQSGYLCDFAHNLSEVGLHPEIYRTNLCNLEICKRALCFFAHSQAELRKPKKYWNDLQQNLQFWENWTFFLIRHVFYI
jgi:hypothetical protein